MKPNLSNLVFAATLLFTFQIIFAQKLPKHCIDEILAVTYENPEFDTQEFLEGLSSTVIKTKAQIKTSEIPIIGLFFGPGSDDSMTGIGISVGCIKAFPESPDQIAAAIKNLGIELAKSIAKKAAKGAENPILGVSAADALSGGFPARRAQGAGAGRATPVIADTVLKECDFVFNPQKKFCYNGAVYDKCDGMEYNPTTHICSGDIAYRALCNSIQYNPTVQKCENNAIEAKCGTDTYYNLATHFCYKESSIVVKCGINPQAYDPDLYECKPGINANGIFLKTPVHHGGENYEAILLGEQIWLARNLNQDASGSVCYNNDASNCAAYGRLFDLEAARTACPADWYLPSDAEWTTLTDYAGWASLKAAGKLNAKSFGGTDEYGFAALPGGFGTSGSFGNAGNFGYWWSSTESGAGSIYTRQINRSAVNRGQSANNNFFSVRCLRYADAAKRKNRFFLSIASEPRGATLKFNGLSSKNCSSTPCRVELKEGKYNINSILNYYAGYYYGSADTAIILTGDRYINIKLTPASEPPNPAPQSPLSEP